MVISNHEYILFVSRTPCDLDVVELKKRIQASSMDRRAERTWGLLPSSCQEAMDARADEGPNVSDHSVPEEELGKGRRSGRGATMTARASMGYETEAELKISTRVRDPNGTARILPQPVRQQHTVRVIVQMLGQLKLDLHPRRPLEIGSLGGR